MYLPMLPPPHFFSFNFLSLHFYVSYFLSLLISIHCLFSFSSCSFLSRPFLLVPFFLVSFFYTVNKPGFLVSSYHEPSFLFASFYSPSFIASYFYEPSCFASCSLDVSFTLAQFGQFLLLPSLSFGSCCALVHPLLPSPILVSPPPRISERPIVPSQEQFANSEAEICKNSDIVHFRRTEKIPNPRTD